MMEIFKSEIFWAAFSGVVALAALLWNPVGNLIPSFKRRRLQKLLNRERKFYKSQQKQYEPNYNIAGYIDTVENALQTIGGLSSEQQAKIKTNLRALIVELRATHKTLVDGLRPFTSNDANKFLREFDTINQNLEALWKIGGGYKHEVRTHCSDVERIVGEIVTILRSGSDESQNNQIQQLCQIGWSMGGIDNEVIVPVMDDILSKLKTELSVIDVAVSDGDQNRAIRLKEKFRFETDMLLDKLSKGLDKMNELEYKL